MKTAASIFLLLAILSASPAIEERGVQSWPVANHFRFLHTGGTTAEGGPVWIDGELPAGLNPDSIRVLPAGSKIPVAAKIDWRTPHARIAWRSTGVASYAVYFDIRDQGETKRLVEPAMIGSGDRLTYGRLDVRGKLAVGLWAHPAPLDFDGDGDLDLIVGCADRPYNGIYLFRNISSGSTELFDRAEWLGPGKKDLVAADFNGDGAIDLVFSGGYYSDVRRNRLSRMVTVQLPRTYHVGRDDLWYPVDWDRDGRIDVLAGVSDWRDYGWDDAFNAKGEWTRGPLHGYIWFHRNTGSNQQPVWAEPVQLNAGGKIIDRYGSPAPNPVDWFGKGRLDLIAGNFLDTVALFRNTGTELAAGADVQAGGKPLRMDLCMIQPRVAQWHKDGRPSLLVAEEDGTISLVENTAPKGQEPRLAAPRYLMQIDPYIKSGALSRPVAVDWNADGKLDILTGNSAGYIQLFGNTGTRENPAFEDRGYLKAGGETIRRIAGPNGSVQGPAEIKWGYSNPSVADWDLDSKLDLIVNDIWGDVVWYRNTGTKQKPELAPAQPVQVEWAGPPPKPDWVWWDPKPKQLLTQWRTTPFVVDWDRDGLPDLAMMNHQGYLALFRRTRAGGDLKLLPPERIFLQPNGRFLNLAAGRAGASGRRKVNLVDWDADGDLDLVSDSDDGPVWFENTGSQAKPVMTPRGTILRVKLNGHNPTPNAADWNGDGKLDLLVGAEDGFLYYFERSYIEASRRTVISKPGD